MVRLINSSLSFLYSYIYTYRDTYTVYIVNETSYDTIDAKTLELDIEQCGDGERAML